MMPCPICDEKPINCQCTEAELRMHYEIEELEEKVPRWIPVCERMPEDGEWAWCYGPNRGCEVACVSKYWDGWVSSDKKNLVAGAYTHWMPLPEPPDCP